MQENEELGSALHMQTLDQLSAAVQKGVPLVQSENYSERSKHTWVYDNGVAVMNLFGPIYPRANTMTSSGATSIAQFTKEFAIAHHDDRVKAIIMDVDSPGGDVRGIGDSAKIMHKIKQSGTKPVKAFASGYMASAAYYIPSIADELIGSESSLSGSIGVVLTGRMGDGRDVEIVSSQSPHKRAKADTDEGKAVLQQRVDDLAEIFVKDVSKYRGVSRDTVLANYGQGDVLVGPRAKRQGLIDGLSTLSQLVEKTASEIRRGASMSGYRQEAMKGSDLSILSFSEEDYDMGLGDLIKKFKPSANATVDLQAQATDESKDKPVVAQGQVDGTTDTSATTPPPAASQGTPPVQTPTRQELMEKFEDAAESFAMRLTLDHRIFPAQQAHAAADLINAKIDDALHGGTIEFVNAEGVVAEGTREAAVRARYESMPKHSMTQETIAAVKEGQAVTANVLAESDPEKVKADAPITAERQTELLALTEQGQKVLAARTKTSV